MARNGKRSLEVETLAHKQAKRRNIPTAEFESVMREEEKTPIRIAYERRNRDLDPQLVWRGKDEQDWSDLVVAAPPLYIQEKVHPKVLIDDLMRFRRASLRAEGEAIQSGSPRRPAARDDVQPDLFADFNGLPDLEAKTEFYQHEQNWSNRMILGDSLQVMASLAEREGLRGKVQCIYIDPPYGIKFNSNFQWSTTSRDVKDGKADHITREPEQVKAFRDTWRDGIHSYLAYLRDRLTVARDLLADSGSIFVQIGDENVHRVRALMDEVFGDENFIALITATKTGGQTAEYLAGVADYIIWWSKYKYKLKFRRIVQPKVYSGPAAAKYTMAEDTQLYRRPISYIHNFSSDAQTFRIFRKDTITSQKPLGNFPVYHLGKGFIPENNYWKTHEVGMKRLVRANRVETEGLRLAYVRYLDDYPAYELTNVWSDIGGIQSRSDPKIYVVQSSGRLVQRCILMTTDPGDLVLDPTCGSGTTAYVAEQWGRRWIAIDTSRVALALARARIMGARYPWYILADSPEGQRKEREVSGKAVPSSLRAESEAIQAGSPRGSAARDDEHGVPGPEKTGTRPTRGDIRLGFVYERVPHITLKSIANNAEIDVIWERYQPELEQLRAALNDALGQNWQEWEIPRTLTPTLSHRERGGPAEREGEGKEADAQRLLAQWWELRIARQKAIDASIAAKAEVEYLYDKPYIDNSRVRVAGPFTVETLSPHRVLAVTDDDELIDTLEAAEGRRAAPERGRDEADFADVICENLKTAGVQQAHKEGRIMFTAMTGWPGEFICAEGRYMEGDQEAERAEGATGKARERRAGIFIGPEFGTVARPDLVAAAREAGDAGFDVLIACAFNYDAHSAEFDKLGRIPILKARMNADLHMAGELKNTGKGNLFVIFGEPDIDIEYADNGQIRVKINGVDVFHPQTGEIASSGPEGIACWFIDTDYNEESFFVRHAYFLGANDPYKALKTTLKAEIDEDAWSTLNSDTSRPFNKPSTGRIAVKVINHLGDEVMKVFGVGKR